MQYMDYDQAKPEDKIVDLVNGIAGTVMEVYADGSALVHQSHPIKQIVELKNCMKVDSALVAITTYNNNLQQVDRKDTDI